jgi:hypothetical protein
MADPTASASLCERAEGAQQDSPGQRPGNPGTPRSEALKGRNRLAAALLVTVIIFVAVSLCVPGFSAAACLEPGKTVGVRSFQPVDPISRAQRPAGIRAVVFSTIDMPQSVTVELELPDGVRCTGGSQTRTLEIEGVDEQEVLWQVEADAAMTCPLRVNARVGQDLACGTSFEMNFLPPVETKKLPYIPEPEPVKTDVLIGAHHCPLWEADKPFMWSQLLKHPERTPALGFYAQENPEISDWETKWAVEHGVSYFIYCWYRASQGGPVKTHFSSAIHDALFKSKFQDKMKFTIMWENQVRGVAGVADEKDLMENLLPFWIDNYFKNPSYVKIDNKPLLYIYRPEFLIDDLGGEDKVVQAFGKMRQACRDAGFDGLYLLGEYRGLDPKQLELMKRIGLDYTFAYCWYVPDNPTPQKAIDTQIGYITKTQELAILPQVVTVSQAWSGWNDEGTIWKIPPAEFKTLLQRAKDIIATFPANELGSKTMILDNWNEWGEGHYIAPYREYGFGYLDAVREVFSNAPEEHTDLIPEDIGMGPYDTAYRDFTEREEAMRKSVSRKVVKDGVRETGMVAWWAFDEDKDAPVAMDYAGHRLGGMLRKATRAPGIDGNALVCDGGCVEVPRNSLLSVTQGVSVSCWVKTDTAGQGNAWILNRVFQGGTATGYRLGVLDGKPCFEVPQTDWSHHLKANIDLPTGRWVHLAGTFAGRTIRIYIDGVEQGTLDRPGPVNTNDFHLCLGNYEIDHASHFDGLVDELKLYDRALTVEEVRAQYKALAEKAG